MRPGLDSLSLRRRAFSNCAPGLLGLSSAFVLPLVSTTGVSAYCRSTTCESTETATSPCERSTDGCATEGLPLRWDDPCISYAVQLDGSEKLELAADEAQALMEEAFRVWANAECSGGGNPDFHATFNGFVSCNKQQVTCGGVEGNESVLIFHDQEWPSLYPATAAGLTSVIADLDTGAIVDADLEINTANYSFAEGDPSALSLRLVTLHEVGHFLGLAHSREPGAIMGLNYQDDAGFDLSEDDIAGICAVYPPSEASLTCTARGTAYDACIEPDLYSGQVCGSEGGEEPTDEGESASNDSGGCSISLKGGGTPRSNGRLALLSMLFGALASTRRRRAQRAS